MPKKESTPEAFAARPVTRVERAFALELEAGEHWWCACGKSERQPFCDGSHRGGPVGPTIVRFDTPRAVQWCGCKQTATPPECDRSRACAFDGASS
jgi:CDGSH-type Zn-finger protein